jgi:hypothetical protein
MSALEGSTRYRVGWRLERRREAYERKRERKSSPPHDVMGLPVAACAPRDGGGG